MSRRRVIVLCRTSPKRLRCLWVRLVAFGEAEAGLSMAKVGRTTRPESDRPRSLKKRRSGPDAGARGECAGSIVVAAFLIASRSQIGELNFPYHAHVGVYLALDLILKHAAGLGQLTHNDEDLAAVDELAPLGTKRDPLTDDEFVRWHVHLWPRLEMRSQCLARWMW